MNMGKGFPDIKVCVCVCVEEIKNEKKKGTD
jgi:hypothetical protein